MQLRKLSCKDYGDRTAADAYLSDKSHPLFFNDLRYLVDEYLCLGTRDQHARLYFKLDIIKTRTSGDILIGLMLCTAFYQPFVAFCIFYRFVTMEMKIEALLLQMIGQQELRFKKRPFTRLHQLLLGPSQCL